MNIASPSTPYGYTLFCDDIRYEINGKLTLAGVYASDMIFPNDFPVTLPKLCLRISYFERPHESTDPIQVRVYVPGDPADMPSFKVDIPREQINALPIPTPEPDLEQMIAIIFHMEAAGMVIKEPGAIRVRAYRGDTEVRLGSMTVRKGPIPPQAVVSMSGVQEIS